MKKFMGGITKRRVLIGAAAVLLSVAMFFSGITVSNRLSPQSDSSFQIGIGQKVITIGTVAYAAGTADFTCDGVADNAEFLAALTALPATGGKISVLTGNYVFAATVTIGKPNVTIEGNGLSSNFTYDNTNYIFTAGGNGWTFRNFVTDAGGINTGATTGWTYENIQIGTVFYAHSGTFASPGTPDYVVGVNTAADDVLGSTGYWVKSGSTGQVVGSTADANADAFIYNVIVLMESKGGGTTKFTIGTFYFAAQISTWAMRNIILEGSGQKTVFKVANGANCGIISLAYYNNHLRNLTVDGNKANQTAGDNLVTLDAGVDYTYCSIENCLVQNGWARGIGVGKQATSRFIVKNNVVTDCNLSGIMVNSIGTIVEGNHIVDCATVTESALWVHVSQGVVIANNVIDGGSVLLAQIRVSSSTDCTVLGNVCNNSLGAGIIGAGCERLAITGNSVVAPVNGGILTDSGCWGVTIASNLVKGSGTGGIYSAGGHYNIITGNIIEDCYDNGIDIGASTDVTIVGNTIRGIKKALEGLGICLNGNSGIVANNIIEFCALNGILVGGSNSDLRIVNNIVKNCRQDTIPAYPVEAGIAVHGYSNLLCTGILVQGNRVFDDQAGTSLLTADPAPGQKVVVVADGTQFKVYQAVTISDDTPDTEDNIIQSISGNTLTMRTNLAHTYTMAQNAVVNGRQTQDYGIGIQNDGGGTIIGVQVCDNDLDGNILGGILLTLSGGTTDAKIYRNRGYVTENSGNFTVVAGAWGVSVNHGLSTNATSVTLGLTSNCTTGVYVLPPITTTAFSVNLTALQGTNITGYWRAVVGAGN